MTRAIEFILALFAIVGLSCPSPVHGASLTKDQWQQLVDSYGKQVNSVSMQFSFTLAENRPPPPIDNAGQATTRDADNSIVRHVDLKWVLPNNWLNAKVIEDGHPDSPVCWIWTRSATKQSWAHPEGNPKVPGTWYVAIGTTDSMPQVPPDLFGLRFISGMADPFQDLRDFEAQGNKSETEIKNGKDPNTTVVSFTAQPKGMPPGRAEYQFDDADGPRLRRIELFSDKQLIGRRTFDDYTKSNGIWFPKHFTWVAWNPDKTEAINVDVTVEKVDINPELKDSDFTFDPPFASYVSDAINKVHYRVGYKNPHAALGMDENDKRLLPTTEPTTRSDGQ